MTDDLARFEELAKEATWAEADAIIELVAMVREHQTGGALCMTIKRAEDAEERAEAAEARYEALKTAMRECGMKIGYLVWMFEDDIPELHDEDPGYAFKVVQIVYAEIVNDA